MPILPVINDPCMGKDANCYIKLEKDEWIFWKKYKANEKLLKDAEKEKELRKKLKKILHL